MSPDAKKEEFRKYLDKAGVVDALTKGARARARECRRAARAVFMLSSRARGLTLHPLPTAPVLVGLYEEPERPPNAVDYVKRTMGAPVGVDVDALRMENEKLRAKIKALECVARSRARPAVRAGACARRREEGEAPARGSVAASLRHSC